MKTKKDNINVIKASGIKVAFNREKLKQSLLRSGANPEQVAIVLEEMEGIIEDNISTRKIYKTAFRILKRFSGSLAARYKLKQAIMELGPTGFPFEQFISELLKRKGYETNVGVIVQGHCISHEIDVIAEKDNNHFMIECKYHNRQGYNSDVKVPMYIQSRFLDVEKKWKELDGHAEKFHQGWVVTNTRFSEDALKFGSCMGLFLMGWDYPVKNGIKDWIDKSGLHPITCLTALTLEEKQQFLDRKIVLCKSLHDNVKLLNDIVAEPKRVAKILKECSELCKHFELTNL